MRLASACYEKADLPSSVQRAIARVLDPAFPGALSHAEKAALAALLRRVDARTGVREFWVRCCNLAQSFDCVPRTITNWLNALEAKGFLVREQGRTRWGSFASLTVRLTDEAASLLGLSAEAQRVKPYDAERKIPSAGNIEVPEQSLSERHRDRTFVVESQGKPYRVPADCAPLLELGVSAPGVFALMGVASRNGKRLGDIVAARLEALRAATNPFALAKHLAADARDYRQLPEETLATPKRAEDGFGSLEQEALARAVEGLEGKLIPMKEAGEGFHAVVRGRDWVEVVQAVGQRTVVRGCLAGAALLQFWRSVIASAPSPHAA